MSKDILSDRVIALEKRVESLIRQVNKLHKGQEQIDALLKMSDKLRKALPHVNFEDPA